MDNPTLHVQVVSPEQILYEGDGEMLVCRTADGDIAFLPGHAPLLGALGVAKVRVILPGDGEQVIAVHAGFVEVSGSRVIVLSDVAELPDQIDIARATAAKERAEAALAAEAEDELAAGALARAALRLEVAGATEPAH
ncbi:MAG: ATP synthase F1 subunit epsilon [Acidimicrobiia bacterium]